jgi:hypothetical protein
MRFSRVEISSGAKNDEDFLENTGRALRKSAAASLSPILELRPVAFLQPVRLSISVQDLGSYLDPNSHGFPVPRRRKLRTF